MDNIRETRSALERLKGQLDAVTKSELVLTEHRLRNLMTDMVSIERKKFSFLRVFGIENYELAHSNFLAWLLDPSGDHDLGSQFVEKFLSKVASKTKNFDVSNLSFSDLFVDREISSDASRLDIRIQTRNPPGSFLCVIENKILSGEGIDQTDRLYNDFHGTCPKELFVFLTLDERAKPKNSNFTSLSYNEVLPILKGLLENSSSANTRFLMKNYINTVERLILSKKFEGFSERTKLYYSYWKYVDEVNRAFNQDRELLLLALEEGIQHRSWWDGKFWQIEKTGGDISIWKNVWYPSGGREGVYLHLYLHKSEPVFSLYIYGEPSEFSAKFAPTFKKVLDEKYPGKLVRGFSKTFAKAVSRFMEKNIHLSLTEKDQVQKILENLDEMVEMFEKAIEQSIEEFSGK